MRGKAPHMATVTRSRSKLPAPKFLADLPPLQVVIRTLDGREHTVDIPDPRVAFAAAFEADGDGATCHLPEEESRSVIIVEKPDDWEPRGPLDTPPNIERHVESTLVRARSLALGFNSAELRNSKGWWAVAVDCVPIVESASENADVVESPEFAAIA